VAGVLAEGGTFWAAGSAVAQTVNQIAAKDLSRKACSLETVLSNVIARGSRREQGSEMRDEELAGAGSSQ